MPKVGAPTGKKYKDGTPKRYGLTKSGRKKPPPSAAQRAAQDRFRAMRGGRGGRGRTDDTVVDTERPTIHDRTPRVAQPRTLGPAFQMKIDREQVTQTQPDDVLALCAGMLFAMRSASTGLLDPNKARIQDLLTTWFGSTDSLGSLPKVDLSAEVALFFELWRVLPEVARTMGFTGDEWANAWNAIAGAATGSSLATGPATTAGLDGMYPPVVGSVLAPFSASNPQLDIISDYGTPIRAPEDLLITKIKTDPGSYGLYLVGISRNADDGNFPTVTGGGTAATTIPHEGTRRHLLAHLATLGAGLKVGDKVERGAILGTVGSSGSAIAPMLTWRVDLWIADDGRVRLVPMDPGDLVPLDVVSGAAAVRPPAPKWSVEDPKVPSGVRDVPAFNVWIGGDLISRGAKVGFGDIDVLGAKVDEGPTEFDVLTSVAKGVGGAIGAIYGGPIGAKIGSKVGGGAAGLGISIGKQIVGE